MIHYYWAKDFSIIRFMLKELILNNFYMTGGLDLQCKWALYKLKLDSFKNTYSKLVYTGTVSYRTSTNQYGIQVIRYQ